MNETPVLVYRNFVKEVFYWSFSEDRSTFFDLAYLFCNVNAEGSRWGMLASVIEQLMDAPRVYRA